jgi:hypothetical protein
MPWSAQVDATGRGGWEGYNWLGLGLVLALAVVVLGRPRDVVGMLRRHAGLALVALALTLVAVSHRVGFGPAIILDLGAWPVERLGQFRSSGRFFWPVAYLLLLGAMVVLARRAPLLCLLAGLIQFADAAPLRAAIAGWAGQRPAWTLDATALRPMLAQAETLTLLPSWPCLDQQGGGGESYALLLESLALASERPVPANTMYVARYKRPPACRDAALAAAPLAPGELRLILPSRQAALAPLVPDGAVRCAPVGTLLACR